MGAAIVVILTQCNSEQSIRFAIAKALCSSAAPTITWREIRERLPINSDTRSVVLSGLQKVERACPYGVARMLQFFSDVNNTENGPRFEIVAGADYEAKVYFLRGRGRTQCAHMREAAFINCWMKTSIATKAKELAMSTLASEGWSVDMWSDCYSVVRADYDEGTEEREFYEQALIDGEVYVYHVWEEATLREE